MNVSLRLVRASVALFALAVAGALCTAAPAGADVVLLLAEPSGKSANYNPTGHVGVYLTRVCAESPTVVRRCRPGEAGAVVSRYKNVAGLDWAAVPILTYLYAVDRAEDVPAFADGSIVAALREQYRRAHLQDLIPDGADGTAPVGPWTQLAGAAYDRRFVGFRVTTTAAQDDDVIAHLNARSNHSRFNLLFRNCADFARDLVNRYYPGALRASVLADFGITTPKQVARTLVKYSAKRPEMDLTAFVIPQIPGSRPESVRARGVSESLVRRKRYSIPLAIVQPWIPASLAAGYLVSGRFNPERDATTFDPAALAAFAYENGATDDESWK